MFKSQLVRGIHLLAQYRRRNQGEITNLYCSRCKRYTGYELIYRIGEFGGGIVITHAERGWQCTLCERGEGFCLFNEAAWKDMRKRGIWTETSLHSDW